jgi:hypothetical protein
MIGIMVLAAVCLYLFLVLLRRRSPVRLTMLTTSISFPIAVFAFTYFAFMLDTGKESWWIPGLSIDLIASQFKILLGLEVLEALKWYLAECHPTLALAYRYAVKLGLFLLFVCILLLGRWRSNWKLLVVACGYWLLVIAVSLLYLPVFLYRTIMPGMIPLIAFVGLQCVSIRSSIARIASIAVLCTMSLVLAIGWIATEARVPQEPWKEMVGYLQSEVRPGDVVVFYPSFAQGPAGYYWPALQDEDVVAIRLLADADEVESRLSKRLSAHRGDSSFPDLFLVVRTSGASQDRREAYRALLAHCESSSIEVSEPQHFECLIVTKYRLRP